MTGSDFIGGFLLGVVSFSHDPSDIVTFLEKLYFNQLSYLKFYLSSPDQIVKSVHNAKC